jgi:MscS family membrane protein
MVARVCGIALTLVILFQGAHELGVPVAGLVTGLGVGGLALALAARPSIENFIGSLVLYTDRPVRVGDFCRYGEEIGKVEEIGLRSTRIRGLDRTVTTIPNAKFSRMEIVNLTRRDRMLLRTTLALRYETTPDQLRFVLAKLRELLLAHPKITNEPARVRFVGFGDYSLDVEIFAYGQTRDWNKFLAIREDVFLRIMNIVAEAGTGFAFPSRTIYQTRDGGLTGDRVEAVEAEVRSWRSEGALPFPEFADDYREQIRNTLDYPPEGSPGTDVP